MMIKIANGEKITVKIHNDEDEKEKWRLKLSCRKWKREIAIKMKNAEDEKEKEDQK
jgi:hypothetical protein